MSTARPAESSGHRELLQDILELRSIGESLKQEVIISPLIDVVRHILDLPKNLDGRSESEIDEVRRNVDECKKTLDDFGYSLIKRNITKPEQSEVFKIVNQADLFAKHLRRMIGKPVQMENGETMIVTDKLFEALTRFNFSIGTPPMTPKGVKAIEQMIFGDGLHDIYQFRELLGGGSKTKYLFDGFVANLDRMVNQSTHYTTAAERRQYEVKAIDFNNFEGLRGLKKSIVSGTAKTAIRLIKEELFSHHVEGAHPVEVVDEPDCLNDQLIERMKREKETIFVVKVSKVPHHLLTTDKLEEKWHGILGRLILVQDPPNTRRASNTLVYSLFPDVTDTLNVLHVKESGTPANTQMNLRSILENFSPEALHGLSTRIRTKIVEYEGRGVTDDKPADVRTQEWKVTAQKDYLALKKFLKFIEFIQEIQKADDQELEAIQADLIEKNEKMAMDYFYKDLKGKGYQIVSVPQGGGRKELGHVGKFLSGKFEARLEKFDKKACRAKLEAIKAENGIAHSSSETLMRKTVGLQNRSPNAALRLDDGKTQPMIDALRERLRRLVKQGSNEASGILSRLEAELDKATSSNIGGKVRAKLSKALSDQGIGSAAKGMERGLPKAAGQALRNALGFVRKQLGAPIDGLEDMVTALEAKMDFQDLSFAERILNDIEKGSLKPNLALSEVGWTFDDVLDEDDFPESNYLKITLGKNGELDTKSLSGKLESIQRKLINFPELFELFCSSTMLIINDPHNPTSRVMRNETKEQLLQIASKYGLTIISDDAYHKQVKKDLKEEQLDITLMEFYERYKSHLPRPVTIYSTLPTTKWAMGAGERTGSVVSNDKDLVKGQNFAEYVRANTDAVNTMSLYMDAEKYDIGLKVKGICKILEPTTLAINEPLNLAYQLLAKDSTSLLDKILDEQFGDIRSDEFSAPLYFKLIEARNDLDRLERRAATPLEIAQYMSDMISELKDFRLDKQTQRDSAARSKIVSKAIKNVAKDYPFLNEVAIEPEGPFYACVRLDNGSRDPALNVFLRAIAKARNIAVVPTKKGHVRFAFGGALDGTPDDYETLGIAIETDLRLLINYWEKFKEERKTCSDTEALEKLFPGGAIDIARTVKEKAALIARLGEKPSKKGKKLVFDRPANVAEMMTSIEPDSATSIVTLSEISCQNLEEMMRQKAFKDLFNFFLPKIKSKVPALMHLEDSEVIAFYGARKFAEKVKDGIFKDQERQVFSKIALEVLKIWFSDTTIKILAASTEHSSKDAILGKEKRLGNLIRDFIDAFMLPEDQKELLDSFRRVSPKVVEYLPAENKYPDTLQAGYRAMKGIKADKSLPPWCQGMINGGEFVSDSTPTDRSPNMSTPGTARVPGVDRAILRRDGDGEDAPTKEFFRERLQKFSEVMDPKDYVMKMVQVGGTKVLLVMNRAYSHYMVEELRLFPQTDLTPEDLASCKPDCVSFLGLPTKVFGEDYRIGYFFDEDSDGKTVPVSWVDAESITDYMGYLKKPILTVANEKVREKEMMPVHGSAFSIVFKNGLRKTIVMGGDSGTGKSETIIAMMEQIIKNEGLASQVEGIEFLSGDMLSMFEGNDGQMYMLGTEEGDFMRMTDIPEDWKERVRHRINNGSKTNITDQKNPRITIGNLCKPSQFQRPVRVNCFFNINNFKVPAGSAVRESESPRNLLLHEYVKGYRGEKGTSGDQPNLYASISDGEDDSQNPVIKEFGKELDLLLGWDILTGPDGKAANAFLSFNDIRGGRPKAENMVKAMVMGKTIGYSNITATRYDVRKNHFFVTLNCTENPATLQTKIDEINAAISTNSDKKAELKKAELLLVKEQENTMKMDDGTPNVKIVLAAIGDKLAKISAAISTNSAEKAEFEKAKAQLLKDLNRATNGPEEVVLDREGIFNKIYNPIASTYAGDPFVSAEKMGPTLERFAGVMEKAGVITGTIYTQLKLDGMTEKGPAKASQDLLKFLIEDERVNARFQTHIRMVDKGLREKYGPIALNSATIPDEVMAHNLFLWEVHESENVYAQDSKGNIIDLETPHYKYDPEKAKQPFSPSLITPEISEIIQDVCNNEEYDKFSLGSFEFVLSEYDHIQAWDSKEELIYQVLIKNGLAKLNYSETNIAQIPPKEVKKAEKIAESIIPARGQRYARAA